MYQQQALRSLPPVGPFYEWDFRPVHQRAPTPVSVIILWTRSIVCTTSPVRTQKQANQPSRSSPTEHSREIDVSLLQEFSRATAEWCVMRFLKHTCCCRTDLPRNVRWRECYRNAGGFRQSAASLTVQSSYRRCFFKTCCFRDLMCRDDVSIDYVRGVVNARSSMKLCLS